MISKSNICRLAFVFSLLMSCQWYLSRHVASVSGTSIDGFLAWLLDAQPTYKNGDLVLLQEILGHPWVIKYIAGVPGERISIKNDIIFVENRKIGALQKTDSKGNLLLPIKEGVIPKDNYFVAGTHSLSFDSRYEKFGLVPHHKIARKAWLIF